MQEIGAFEAQNTLGALLDRVERGEEIIISRRGTPVARLVPSGSGTDLAAFGQRLSALGHLFDWLVVGQVLPAQSTPLPQRHSHHAWDWESRLGHWRRRRERKAPPEPSARVALRSIEAAEPVRPRSVILPPRLVVRDSTRKR